MSKHTPGPWMVGKPCVARLDGWPLNSFPISGSGQAIARVWAGTPGKIPFGNEEANAHLIAAAPDLLDVCQRIMALPLVCTLLSRAGNEARIKGEPDIWVDLNQAVENAVHGRLAAKAVRS